MRILHISNTGYPLMSGLELFVFNLSKYQSAKGHKIYYICNSYNKYKKREVVKNINFIRYSDFGLPKILYICRPINTISITQLSIPLIKRENIDLIHIHDYFHTGIAMLLINKLTKVPFIYSEYGSIREIEKPLYIKSLEQAIIKKIISNSRYTIAVDIDIYNKLTTILNDEYNDDISNKIHLITTGIDTNHYSPNVKIKNKMRETYGVEDKFVVLFLGKFNKLKGIDILAKSIPLICKRCPNIVFILVGYGPLENYLKNYVKKFGLEDKIIFTGRVSNPEDYFNMADIYIYPSPIGVFSSLSFLGAMATGVPSIVTKSADAQEYFKDYKDLIYLEKPVTEKKIAEKVIELYENKKLQKILKINSRKIIKREFDEKIMFDKIMKLYSEI